MPRQSSAVVVVVVALLTLLPVLYVLSVGPAVVLYDRGMIGQRSMEWVYTPLEYAGSIPVIGDALRWYVGLFRPVQQTRR